MLLSTQKQDKFSDQKVPVHSNHKPETGIVVHVCNPSTKEAENQEMKDNPRYTVSSWPVSTKQDLVFLKKEDGGGDILMFLSWEKWQYIYGPAEN